MSQKYTVIALHFWSNDFFLVFQIWVQNTIGGQFLEHCHLIWNCPWFLKRWWLLFNLSNLRALPAKSKCKNALRFLMKKTSFAPLINNFLYFFKESKVICQRGKTFFFNQKSEGILHLLFAGTKIRLWGYCLQNLILMKNSPLFMMAFMILREITLDFSDKVFPLGFEGISYNSGTITSPYI